MSQLTGPIISSTQPEFTSNATAAMPLGTEISTADGRKVVYVKAGATSLVPGNLIQSPALVSDYVNIPYSNSALVTVGSKTVSVQIGATALAASALVGGLLQVSNAAGLGESYGIVAHDAAIASANVVLTLDEPIKTAANSTSRVDLVQHRYRGVIQNPTTPTGTVVGAAHYPIANAQFGFIVKSGDAAVLIEGTPANGSLVAPSANVAGAAGVTYTSNATQVITASASAPCGRIRQTGVDAKTKIVTLHIS